MEDSVQVISREIMKPSPQTPPHPKKLKLSYIDQMLISIYIPIIFFFNGDESRGLTSSNHLQISQRLKHSLLQIVPSFYPLAGRLKNRHFIDCNDAGFEFVEARARARLDDVVSKDERLKLYLPRECIAATDHGGRPLLVVQATFFGCGGIVIGARISHKVCDMASVQDFVEAWAAAFRGKAETARRRFGAASYFPALAPLRWGSSRLQKIFVSDENYITKRFVFDKEKLDALRHTTTSASDSGIKDPSRVELVSAFIWKHFTKARLQKGKAKRTCVAIHVVNLRPRTEPPRLLENVIGNCIMSAVAYPPWRSFGVDFCLQELVESLRISIRRVKGSYITKPLSKESYLKDLAKIVSSLMVIMGKLEWCFFTSWRGFPVYDLDFGWGKPVRFATTSMPLRNSTILVSSKGGDGVEAIVTMKPDALEILDVHFNLIPANISN